MKSTIISFIAGIFILAVGVALTFVMIQYAGIKLLEAWDDNSRTLAIFIILWICLFWEVTGIFICIGLIGLLAIFLSPFASWIME